METNKSATKAKKRPPALALPEDFALSTVVVAAAADLSVLDSKEKRELKSLASTILSGNPALIPSIYLASPTVEDCAKRMDIATANRIIMLQVALVKITELNPPKPTVKIENKGAGINDGFIITANAKSKYFIKSFLPAKQSGKTKIHEFFAYKALEHLGYGAKCHFSSYNGSNAVLISEDLSNIKEKDGATTSKTFVTSEALSEKSPIVYSRATCEHMMALEIFSRFLGIGDVSKNLANSGVVKTVGPKTKGEESKQKPKIIDLNFNEKNISLVSSHGVENIENILEDIRSGQPMSTPFIGKIPPSLVRNSYQAALKHLLEGRPHADGTDHRPSLQQALSMAYKDCEIVSKTMSKGNDVEEFVVIGKEPDLSQLSLSGSPSTSPSPTQGADTLNRTMEILNNKIKLLQKELVTQISRA